MSNLCMRFCVLSTLCVYFTLRSCPLTRQSLFILSQLRIELHDIFWNLYYLTLEAQPNSDGVSFSKGINSFVIGCFVCLFLFSLGKEMIETYFNFRLFRLWKSRQHSKMLEYDDLLWWRSSIFWLVGQLFRTWASVLWRRLRNGPRSSSEVELEQQHQLAWDLLLSPEGDRVAE